MDRIKRTKSGHHEPLVSNEMDYLHNAPKGSSYPYGPKLLLEAEPEQEKRLSKDELRSISPSLPGPRKLSFTALNRPSSFFSSMCLFLQVIDLLRLASLLLKLFSLFIYFSILLSIVSVSIFQQLVFFSFVFYLTFELVLSFFRIATTGVRDPGIYYNHASLDLSLLSLPLASLTFLTTAFDYDT